MSDFEPPSDSSPHSITREYSDDNILSDVSYSDKEEENQNNNYATILNNIPNMIEHFIGDNHESILDSIYEDITRDNMNPFIVLLGPQGIGKTTVTSTICNDLLQENNQVFNNGILYIDLMKWHKLYNYKTFEDCLIWAIQECGLNTYWIQKYDDFLDITPANIFTKMDEYLSNSLIIFEDFDRFQEINDISFQDCNNFLFNLFENLSITTKIIITSRKKLPIYYNFNLFRTKFYQLETFSKSDTLNYLLTYCPMFNENDIVPYLIEINNFTANKPSLLHGLYKLWQSIRMFETTFHSIFNLYKQLDEPSLSYALSSTSISANSANSANSSNSNSNNNNVLPDTPPKQSLSISPQYIRTTSNGKPPLFAYTNLYTSTTSSPSPSPSPSIETFHSPLSTINAYGLLSFEEINKTNRRSDVQQFYKKTNKFERRRSDKVQQFYKVTNVRKQRYSYADRHSYDETNNNNYKQEREMKIPLTPIYSNQSECSDENENENENININKLNLKHTFGKKKHSSLMRQSFTSGDITKKEKEKKKKKSNKKKRETCSPIVHTHVGTLNENNIKTHLNNLSLTSLNITDINIEKILAIEDKKSDIDGSENEHDHEVFDDAIIIHNSQTETYDEFLAALGAEIQRQQKQEDENENEIENNNNNNTKSKSKSMHNYSIRVSDIDIEKKENNNVSNLRKSQPVWNISGNNNNYLGVFDLPATPPLSSCGGIISDGSVENNMNTIDIDSDDNISVNSDTLRENKLMSINLIQNDYENKTNPNKKIKKKTVHVSKMNKNHKKNINRLKNGTHKIKVGNVYFNKFLRMTLLLNICIDSLSHKWLINGVARALRTQEIRFTMHKNEGIADKYSYVSLLCRCDEYDIKQLKNTFEFTFISHQLEDCISQSLGKSNLKIICASCLSYRHYKYLYSQQFLNWITNANSLPNAMNVIDQEKERKIYKYKGINKMAIINADYIQLPYSQKDVLSGDREINYAKNKKELVDQDDNALLTPPNTTILHFMSVL